MDITGPIPKNARGRFYHLDCAPGELAPYILTCGDPFRAQRIARRLTRVDMRRKNREFLTYTGIYQNIPVSVMATGIGAPASAIAIVEAANCVAPGDLYPPGHLRGAPGGYRGGGPGHHRVGPAG